MASFPHAAAPIDELAALWQQGAGAIEGRGAGHHADLGVAAALAPWVQGAIAL